MLDCTAELRRARLVSGTFTFLRWPVETAGLERPLLELIITRSGYVLG